MNIYSLLILLHILAVIALIGPLILTPKWLYLYHHDIGRRVLKDVHFVTGISGWIVFLSGVILLWLQNAALLSFLWMKISIGIFIILQIIDNFWADKQEEELEHNPKLPVSKLKAWLIIKLALYVSIAVLMIQKPPIF